MTCSPGCSLLKPGQNVMRKFKQPHEKATITISYDRPSWSPSQKHQVSDLRLSKSSNETNCLVTTNFQICRNRHKAFLLCLSWIPEHTIHEPYKMVALYHWILLNVSYITVTGIQIIVSFSNVLGSQFCISLLNSTGNIKHKTGWIWITRRSKILRILSNIFILNFGY